MSKLASIAFAEIHRRFGSDPPTMAEIVALRAVERPEAIAFRFLRHSGPPDAWTYGQLDARVSACAAAIVERTEPADRVILLFQPGLEFVAAFLACQRAGTVPVPISLPRLREPSDRIDAVIANCRPSLVMSHKAAHAAADLKLPVSMLYTDTVVSNCSITRACIRRTDLALLQYTSGSTGTPKGVMVSHRNIAANVRDIIEVFDLTHLSRSVSWLPTHHDMGLIGCALTPIAAGMEMALMAPSTFVRDPLRWLKAIATHHAEVSGAPNLAFEICARRLMDANRPDPQELDLSCWRAAFVGAEPVRAATLMRFASAAAPYGFRPEAFLPCYGLAEATLFIAGASGTPSRLIDTFDAHTLGQGEARHAPRVVGQKKSVRRVPLVSCGNNVTIGKTHVTIVDPEHCVPLPDSRIGEIWASGPGIASGYWDRPGETTATFGRQLPGRAVGYLRTGDLGFIYNARLFVTGRLRDVIIMNGVKYHPEDIEHTIASQIPELTSSPAAVFAIESEMGTRVVVMQELARERRRTADVNCLAKSIRTAIWDAHGLAVNEIIILSPGTLALTSSGKVQRGRCRELYFSGELVRFTAPNRPPQAPVLENSPESRALKLRAILAEVLGRDFEEIAMDRPLSWFGLDSLRTTEVQMLAESRMGWSIAGDTLHSDMTLLQIVERRNGPNSLQPGVFWIDTVLPATLQPPAGRPDGQGEVLITGATGLVGGHLVRELLGCTEKELICLVRGESDDEACRRLFEHLKTLGVPPSAAKQRVKFIRGDTAMPRFGLTEESFDNLARSVGTIFHNAAKLDFSSSYARLRGANVASVRAVIDLAARGRPKLVAHTSSIGVLESPVRAAARRINENVPLDFPETLAIGYAQTKWVADALLLRARARGFTVSIFRPSWIVGHEKRTPSGDFVARFLQGCRRIGALPESNYRWDFVTADFVAKAIVALTLADKGRNAVYHLGAARRLSVPQLVSRMRHLGSKVSLVPIDEWRARLRIALADDAENPLRPVAGLFTGTEELGAAADAYLLGRVPEMDSRRTRSRLRNLGVDCPHFSNTLLASLLDAELSQGRTFDAVDGRHCS